MRIVQIVGARPQFVKLGPVARELARRKAAGADLEEVVVHTGQHYDPAMSAAFFDELALPPPAVNLGIGSAAHGAQTGRMLIALEDFLLGSRPDVVVVYGDTNSTLAGALAAAKLGLAVAHVEAGLRSFRRTMPEELNRVATDHLSERLLAPTAAAMDNLRHEGLAGRARLVGDVMFDAVATQATRAGRDSRLLAKLGLAAGTYGVVTLHRAENTAPGALERALAAIGGVSAGLLPLVFPLHPRTRAAIEATLPGWRPPAALTIIEPVGALDMLALTASAAVVLTDSGGLQKEAFILGRPCVTLRGETEWVETVAAGANVVVGTDPEAVLLAARRWRDTGWGAGLDLPARAAQCYGGGLAASRIVDELQALVAQRSVPDLATTQ